MSEKSGEETKEQRRTRETDQLYSAIGRYTVAFEHMVNAVRLACVTLTAADPAHQRLMNVIFHHKSMAAWAMLDIFRSMVGEQIADESKLTENEILAIKGVLKSISQAYQNACEVRNDHLHATWLIGYGNEETEDFSSAAFIKGKPTAEGLKFLPGPKTVEDIDALTAECERIKEMVFRFHGAYCHPGGPRVAKNFVKKGKDWAAPDRIA